MHVATSGVLLEYDGCFVFQTGLNRVGDALGVVRLGGHVEPAETAIECAIREVREEGRVPAQISSATTAYRYTEDGDGFALEPYDWPSSDPRPLLVASMTPDPGLSVTYLATTTHRPTPGAETQALIHLSPAEVDWLTSETVTFGTFLANGGRVHEAVRLRRDLPLRPHGQLRALAQLLRLDLIATPGG